MNEGIVYLIVDWGSSPERYKIGISKNNIDKRISQLQTGSSNKLVLLNTFKSKNYKKIEKFLHKVYSEYSTDGGSEWFELPNDTVLNFKTECKKIDESINVLINFNNPFV